MELKTLSTIDLAKIVLYYIHKSTKSEKAVKEFDDDEGILEKAEVTSRLKLIKLLYYIQGYHIAVFDKPIFTEEIQAWKHGPVIPALYRWVKEFKDDEEMNKQAFKTLKEVTEYGLSTKQLQLIKDVLAVYTPYTAYGLRDKTHSEEPWINYYEENCNRVIPYESLKVYFDTQVDNEYKKRANE